VDSLLRRGFSVRIAEVGIEHNDGKRQEKNGVLVFKETAFVIADIVFPEALGKGKHYPIHSLGFSWETESASSLESDK